MTSGNLGGEPIAYRDDDAATRLAPLVDAWLRHDRPIHVPVDDSVSRVVDGRESPVRRSRGYAPLPVALPPTLPVTVPATLAVGADLKNTCAIGQGGYAWLSQHIGDMDDLATLEAFGASERHLERLVGVTARARGRRRPPRLPVHRLGATARRGPTGAHRAAPPRARRRGDGRARPRRSATRSSGSPSTAPATAPTARCGAARCWSPTTRASAASPTWATCRCPGGDASVHRPYRMALAHLWAAGLPWDADLAPVAACPSDELGVLAHQLSSGFGAVPTSSMGRLFDAVASLAGVRHVVDYEAEAAIELEGLARGVGDAAGSYAFGLTAGEGPTVADRRAGGARRRRRPAPRRAGRGGGGPVPRRRGRPGRRPGRPDPYRDRPVHGRARGRGLRQRAAALGGAAAARAARVSPC